MLAEFVIDYNGVMRSASGKVRLRCHQRSVVNVGRGLMSMSEWSVLWSGLTDAYGRFQQRSVVVCVSRGLWSVSAEI